MHWYPGEIMTRATRRGRIGDGLEALGSSLRQPLHGLISDSALGVKDRVPLTELPNVYPTAYRRLERRKLLWCFR